MTYCLIHGAWHDESCWDLLTPLLHQAGHMIVTPRLPVDDPEKQLEHYADIALSQLDDLDSTIIVGHSLSSDVAAIAAAKAAPNHLVYLCPLLAIFDRPSGEPTVFREGAFDLVLDDELDRSYWPEDAAVSVMYRALNPKLAASMVSKLRAQSSTRRISPPISEPPRVASTLIYSTEDEIFEPDWSDWAARNILGVEPVRMKGGHFPMLEQPGTLADILLALAR